LLHWELGGMSFQGGKAETGIQKKESGIGERGVRESIECQWGRREKWG